MAGARILVVDDEPLVLRVVVTVLQKAGYDAVAVEGAEQALEAVDQRGKFDLVVSDVIMPGMCGTELASQIRNRHPSCAIMLMSGCVSGERLPSGLPFIGKPFTAPDLLAAVSRALRPAAASPRPA